MIKMDSSNNSNSAKIESGSSANRIDLLKTEISLISTNDSVRRSKYSYKFLQNGSSNSDLSKSQSSSSVMRDLNSSSTDVSKLKSSTSITDISSSKDDIIFNPAGIEETKSNKNRSNFNRNFSKSLNNINYKVNDNSHKTASYRWSSRLSSDKNDPKVKNQNGTEVPSFSDCRTLIVQTFNHKQMSDENCTKRSGWSYKDISAKGKAKIVEETANNDENQQPPFERRNKNALVSTTSQLDKRFTKYDNLNKSVISSPSSPTNFRHVNSVTAVTEQNQSKKFEQLSIAECSDQQSTTMRTNCIEQPENKKDPKTVQTSTSIEMFGKNESTPPPVPFHRSPILTEGSSMERSRKNSTNVSTPPLVPFHRNSIRSNNTNGLSGTKSQFMVGEIPKHVHRDIRSESFNVSSPRNLGNIVPPPIPLHRSTSDIGMVNWNSTNSSHQKRYSLSNFDNPYPKPKLVNRHSANFDDKPPPIPLHRSSSTNMYNSRPPKPPSRSSSYKSIINSVDSNDGFTNKLNKDKKLPLKEKLVYLPSTILMSDKTKSEPPIDEKEEDSDKMDSKIFKKFGSILDFKKKTKYDNRNDKIISAPMDQF